MHLAKSIARIAVAALNEDGVRQDLTTRFTIPQSSRGKAVIFARESGVLCGIDIARFAYRYLDKSLVFHPYLNDGQSFKKNKKIAILEGRLQSVLSGERVALNFLSLLSGIATATNAYVARLKGTKARLLDTRKTTPTLRILEKYAVETGGGSNHRYGLSDGIIVKDNHLRAAACIKNGKLNKAHIRMIMKRLRKGHASKIEIEVETLKEFHEIAPYLPDIIMLDNFPLRQLRAAVDLRNRHFPGILLEASGGVTLAKIRAIALAGVDFISVGSITHSPRAIDFTLEILA